MSENFITENLKTKIVGEYDVFVLGGGIAGISAALAAARQGKKVLLCEKSFILGGLATSGLVTIYLPLCDGMGNQVSFGIAEELLKLSIKDYCNEKRGYNNWVLKNSERNETTARYEVDFNPHLFAISAERLLSENGVEILYGTMVTACEKIGNKIDCVIVENKSGRQGFKAKTFIDASGDCDLAYFSNTPTVNYTQGNILAAWYYFIKNGQYNLNMLGFCDVSDTGNATGDMVKLQNDTKFYGLSGDELSQMTVQAHNSMYSDMLRQLKKDKNAQPVTMPTIPQIRMTRRIDGEYTLCEQDIKKHFESSIGMVSDWKTRGPVYEVPFGTLFNKETVNLICAGRCVSNDEYMWDIMRVIPCCAVTGQAAGTAASITDDFTKIDLKTLQKTLTDNGVVLHF